MRGTLWSNQTKSLRNIVNSGPHSSARPARELVSIDMQLGLEAKGQDAGLGGVTEPTVRPPICNPVSLSNHPTVTATTPSDGATGLTTPITPPGNARLQWCCSGSPLHRIVSVAQCVHAGCGADYVQHSPAVSEILRFFGIQVWDDETLGRLETGLGPLGLQAPDSIVPSPMPLDPSCSCSCSCRRLLVCQSAMGDACGLFPHRTVADGGLG
ncbi:hypothetical protein B0T16DRAFT_246635 [Cercophora newfieldiana]|uniref:Uncharacterized protein n=1 Tax=Cercophora newfieldiana TaxID=92897 RepID=A0AA40CJP9_9PEZI|nr:hypothetical protein B0T16DRAFT_246635 [Cercophora newfieldiana]